MFAVLSYVIHNMSGWARATVVYMIFTAERSVLHIALRLALSFLEIGGLAFLSTNIRSLCSLWSWKRNHCPSAHGRQEGNGVSRWQWPDDAYVGEHRGQDTVTKKEKSRRVWARRGGREKAALAEDLYRKVLPSPWEREKRNALLDLQW